MNISLNYIKGISVSSGMLVGNGDSFLINITLCSVALGDLLGIDYRNRLIIKLISVVFGGFCLIIIGISAVLYNYTTLDLPVDGDKLFYLAFGSFIFSAVQSTICVAYAEMVKISKEV